MLPRLRDLQRAIEPIRRAFAADQIFRSGRFSGNLSLCLPTPSRQPKLGHYPMMVGILMLLFIGFNRIWHFVYIRLDAMLCGFFKLTRLPAASTYWRYVDSLGINQARSILKVTGILRERVWQLCDRQYARIRVNIDTTVKTVYGQVSRAPARATIPNTAANRACGRFWPLSKKPMSI